MSLISNLKPIFWDHVDKRMAPHKYYFDFRKIWKLTIILTLTVSLIPLLVITFIGYRANREAIDSVNHLRTARLVSNTRRSVSFFIDERKAALDYVNLSDSFEWLVSSHRLETILKNLKNGFGGFVDLGVINDKGIQVAYAGPYNLENKNYFNTIWFKEVMERGMYMSDVFMGFRNVPHIVIAIKHKLHEGGFYILRATLDTAGFNNLLSGIEVSGEGDAFIINKKGVLQTPSRYQGRVLDRLNLKIPEYSERSQVMVMDSATHEPIICISSDQNSNNPSPVTEVNCLKGPLMIGYAYIPETPFILMIIKDMDRLLKPWDQARNRLITFLAISVFAIVIVILGGITYLVNQIYWADKRRLMTMHEVEYASKMASLGRLSAGVAHEINNPLAIINENAGLIKDLIVYKSDLINDGTIEELTDTVISSVKRCAKITRRLLSFARHSEFKTTLVDLKEVVLEVLSFTRKEAEYRSIDLKIDSDDGIPLIKSDRGRLQEIFLNLITNAFAAIKENGSLNISIKKDVEADDLVLISFTDDGHGIPEKDLERIFEPFFSTKTGQGGTGLGLSITYGLIKELKGTIDVKSQPGEGTTFTVRFFINQSDENNEPQK